MAHRDPESFLNVIAGKLRASLPAGVDPRAMRPVDMIRLLNSTPLGTVLSERRMHVHRSRAGYRIGDKQIDLFRYAAWLATERHEALRRPAIDPAEAHRERMAKRSRDQHNKLSEIPPLAPVANPERRQACRFDLRRFLQEYFPSSTGLSPFSADHIRVIQRIQLCAIEGGLFGNAVYRGFAKTTIAENAAIWAVLYGHRRFVPIFGSSAAAAKDSIDSIKKELTENDLLAADFPEVCIPIQELRGKAQRCQSQTYRGERTHIAWTVDRVVLPSLTFPAETATELGVDIDDAGYSVSAGAVVTSRGISAGARGMKYKRIDGTQQRPDFVIIDDPQTDEEAGSPHSVNKIINVIRKSILNLGGHRSTLACVMNATVIEPDDVVDQLLDPKRNPSWQRERIPMVRKWADAHDSFWLGEYARVRTTYDPDNPDDQGRAKPDAALLYESRRAEANAGCDVSWESCVDPDSEISAIQHAYNKLIDLGEEAFAAECQNKPLPKIITTSDQLTEPKLAAKLSHLPRGLIPLACTKLTAFIDVQQKMLFYTVCAWGPGFNGSVIDYGTSPDQKRSQFTLRDASRTLQKAFPGSGIEGAIFAGLRCLTAELMPREWKREDGTLLRINRCLVDSGWGELTETVHSFCRQSTHNVKASKGLSIGPTQMPISQFARKPGEEFGLECVISPAGNGRQLAKYDTNWWKSFVAKRWLTALGDHGSLSIFGTDREAHRAFFAHQLAEKPQDHTSGGRTVVKWILPPSKTDNQWWDCVIGAAAAASFEGIRLENHEPQKRRKKVHVPEHLLRKR